MGSSPPSAESLHHFGVGGVRPAVGDPRDAGEGVAIVAALAVEPCTGCRDAAAARGWFSEQAAPATAASEPASSAESSDSEY